MIDQKVIVIGAKSDFDYIKQKVNSKLKWLSKKWFWLSNLLKWFWLSKSDFDWAICESDFDWAKSDFDWAKSDLIGAKVILIWLGKKWLAN